QTSGRPSLEPPADPVCERRELPVSGRTNEGTFELPHGAFLVEEAVEAAAACGAEFAGRVRIRRVGVLADDLFLKLAVSIDPLVREGCVVACSIDCLVDSFSRRLLDSGDEVVAVPVEP